MDAVTQMCTAESGQTRPLHTPEGIFAQPIYGQLLNLVADNAAHGSTPDGFRARCRPLAQHHPRRQRLH
ncbi:MAG: hypothetical protein ACYC3N_06225 [Halothiobacillus sp.]